MKALLKSLAVLGSLALGLTFSVSGVNAAGPAGAMSAPAVSGGIVHQIQGSDGQAQVYLDRERGRGWDRDDRRWDRGDRRWDRDRYDRRWHRDRYDRRYYRSRPNVYFEFNAGPRYVEPRRVYRPAPRYSLSQAHYNWCSNRYRSYRAYDNSFQPYNGPRQACYSPYS
ncbi:BA14K family protein [Mesorhizobium sp. CAU 1732]|uniref:BA14K family protein n=1 Tax=Mesorhizobium sp. CAU 1732 TaxID=3140358 RepID=UPI003261B0EF